ncbi:hypothetical protein PVAG01_06082 [Phlyctema vagabunda]|uniref:Uncharacterized protein n=1 Tax=Phlyctema vagabunda TaxID=108571 RepID=A0ABR4PG00_9HELO
MSHSSCREVLSRRLRETSELGPVSNRPEVPGLTAWLLRHCYYYSSDLRERLCRGPRDWIRCALRFSAFSAPYFKKPLHRDITLHEHSQGEAPLVLGWAVDEKRPTRSVGRALEHIPYTPYIFRGIYRELHHCDL